jgi:NAD(P)-dependent dehydrogenase (short-subunit alcohol dehydrogenase family)
METILVTGANRGIGQALVEQGLKRGARVIAAMRHVADADFSINDPARLKIIALDVTDDASVAAAAAAISEPIDILINNAGIAGPQTPAASTSDFAGFLQTLNINTVGPLRVSHAFLPHVRRGTAKKITTITSGMGELNANSDWTPYRTSKVAVNKVMRALASDLRVEGIAVGMFCPGWVRTRMGGSNASISPEESAKGLYNQIDALNLKNTGIYQNYAGRSIPFAS